MLTLKEYLEDLVYSNDILKVSLDNYPDNYYEIDEFMKITNDYLIRNERYDLMFKLFHFMNSGNKGVSDMIRMTKIFFEQHAADYSCLNLIIENYPDYCIHEFLEMVRLYLIKENCFDMIYKLEKHKKDFDQDEKFIRTFKIEKLTDESGYYENVQILEIDHNSDLEILKNIVEETKSISVVKFLNFDIDNTDLIKDAFECRKDVFLDFTYLSSKMYKEKYFKSYHELGLNTVIINQKRANEDFIPTFTANVINDKEIVEYFIKISREYYARFE